MRKEKGKGREDDGTMGRKKSMEQGAFDPGAIGSGDFVATDFNPLNS